MTYFAELERIILKFIWKHKRIKLSKAILNKKRNTRSIIVPDFKSYCRVTGSKTPMVLPLKQA
jgi:hypothetical protein